MPDAVNRTVLVTGAAGGLGRAFALGFAARGYRVAVADLNAEGAAETAALMVEQGTDAWSTRVDVTSVESTEQVNSWLSDDAELGSGLKGMAASPGIAEGPARVIMTSDDLSEIQPGDILVTPVTAPSWGPIFGKIAATVTDIGGMMSHAAIVCREYGLPAVTGTGSASTTIITGQRLRVDGTKGTVEILDDLPLAELSVGGQFNA